MRYLKEHDIKEGFLTPKDYKDLMSGLPKSVPIGIPEQSYEFQRYMDAQEIRRAAK